MKIYNSDKTTQLNASDLDLEAGRLVNDKIVTIHHDAVAAVPKRSAMDVYNDLKAAGIDVELINGLPKRVIARYPETGGKSVEAIQDVCGNDAIDAYDEYEDICVYIPYTDDELRDKQLSQLRRRRETECFPIINRGQLWYAALTDAQREDLHAWYHAYLDITDVYNKKIENGVEVKIEDIIPIKPAWIK